MTFFHKIIFILFFVIITVVNTANASNLQLVSSPDFASISVNKNNDNIAIDVVNNRYDLILNSTRNSEISQSQNRNNNSANGFLSVNLQNKKIKNENNLKRIFINPHVLHNISPNLKNVLIVRAP